MRKIFLIHVLGFLLLANLYGQAPPGYYDGASGLTGEALRNALFNIIKDHNVQTYSSLWVHFMATDQKGDGSVWDMYSDIPGGNPAYVYIFIADQCGNYSAEGDCYNREHSFPTSWFNDQPPMNTDLFQIYPTDGFVNGKRSNYPYGETGNPTWISTNESMVGNSSYTGYSGVVFEPIDEYKGDFARTYFYMMTRYLDKVSGWSSPMLSGNNLSGWAREMLGDWHDEDPVSDKEIERNNAVYGIQANRNPYIDHPGWVEDIWGIPTSVPAGDEISAARLYYSRGLICIERKDPTQATMRIMNFMGQVMAVHEIYDEKECVGAKFPAGPYIVTYQSEHFVSSYKLVIN